MAETTTGSVLIVVVSDGAGSASHGGSGSRFICEDLSARLTTEVLSGKQTEGGEWLRECVSESRSALLAKASDDAMPARQLAATLLCAVIATDQCFFAQVGDGAIVTSEVGTDEWAWLFWPQRGEYANSTSFITDVGAMDELQVDFLSQRLEEVALFTDGLQHLVLDYADRTVHSPFFERMFGPVRAAATSGGDELLSTGLADYLRSPAVTARADDDLTLVMASRRHPE